MFDRTSRRFFLGAATAAAASRVWGANDRINVAIVGLGGRGSSHLNIYSKLSEARVAGICDIDQAARERAQAGLLKNTGEKAKLFEDMREAFADSGIDAVQAILRVVDVPIVFVTAFPERLLTGERPEPTYLVTKPFDPDTLRVTIAQALSFSPARPAPALAGRR